MATPLYKYIKGAPNDPTGSNAGYTTFVFPSAAKDISQAYQNDNYKMSFSKFALLNFDLDKMDLENLDEFNTESTNVITDKNDLLVNHIRNYVANRDVVIMESLLGNNNNFYDPNVVRTVTERNFWRWLRKTGLIEFEPAIPNDEYIDSQDFAVDDTLTEDYFKEYVWKERSVIDFTISNITQETFDNAIIDPFDNIAKNIFKITVKGSSNIKPGDRITVTSDGNINIGFRGDMNFSVNRIDTDDFGGTVTDKNNIIYILSDTQLIWNNFAVASLKLVYSRVLQYLGEISSVNNVQNADKSYTEVTAFLPDQNGQTPDILFRLKSDSNYSPTIQYPIIPSQDQPEIVGAEQADSPINVRPSDYPGDGYAYFDVDQKYVNASGLQDRRSGDYYGIFESSRNSPRVASSPFVFPEFDGTTLDGLTVDYDTSHYTKMNLATKKSKNFDEFSGQAFNNLPPKDFPFNAILWYYQIEDLAKGGTETIDSTTTNSGTSSVTKITITRENPSKVNKDTYIGMNLYGITILNPVNPDTNNIDSYTKLVANGKQDGLSYMFNLNLNFNILNDNVIEKYDPQKTYSEFSLDLYNTVMRQVIATNDVYMSLIPNVVKMRQDINNLATLLYTQTDIRDINSRIKALNTLLNTYKRNQISDSDSIIVNLDESTSPPTLKLQTVDARYSSSVIYSISSLYDNQSNTVLNNKIIVPKGKDFLVSVVNDDNSDITLDNNLNIVLEKDLDFKQTCEIKIYPSSASFNKKLDVSILTKFSTGVDSVKGLSLIKGLDLPIDKNLNPNAQLDGIKKRWSNYPQVYPKKIGMKKIGDIYYLVLNIDPMLVNSFKTGDVLYLENFQLVKTDNIAVPIVADMNGQYTIIGDITNNELVFEVNNTNFVNLFTELRKTDTNPTIYLNGINLAQPAFIRYNTGWHVSITRNNNAPTTVGNCYLVEVKPLNLL